MGLRRNFVITGKSRVICPELVPLAAFTYEKGLGLNRLSQTFSNTLKKWLSKDICKGVLALAAVGEAYCWRISVPLFLTASRADQFSQGKCTQMTPPWELGRLT